MESGDLDELDNCFMGWLDAGPFRSPWISIFFSSPERGAPSHRPARRAQCPTHLTRQALHEDTPRHRQRTHSPPRKEHPPPMLPDLLGATHQHLNTMFPWLPTLPRHQHPLPRDLHQCSEALFYLQSQSYTDVMSQHFHSFDNSTQDPMDPRPPTAAQQALMFLPHRH